MRRIFLSMIKSMIFVVGHFEAKKYTFLFLVRSYEEKTIRESNMEIVFVAAYGENGEMGKNNELLWYLPGDLPRFKQLTIGSPIIMGRKTFDSIGKPLPGRTNIVLSANKQWSQPGVTVASSIDESLELARAEQPEKVSIIGGGQIYKLFLPFATILEITYVYDAPVADTYFPNFSEDNFTEINRIEVRDSQPHFDYITYHRK